MKEGPYLRLSVRAWLSRNHLRPHWGC